MIGSIAWIAALLDPTITMLVEEKVYTLCAQLNGKTKYMTRPRFARVPVNDQASGTIFVAVHK